MSFAKDWGAAGYVFGFVYEAQMLGMINMESNAEVELTNRLKCLGDSWGAD